MSLVRASRPHRLLVALAGTAVLALGMAACDDDDEGGDEAEPVTEVTLTADDAGAPDEYTFELSATPTEETRSITLDNQGDESHALVFARIGEGFTADEAIELQGRRGSATEIVNGGARAGQSQTFEIEEPLEPGDYVMICPIGSPQGPHYELGQREDFTIG